MKHEGSQQTAITTITQPVKHPFIQWLQDPMGSIVASSVAVIGSFGFVLSGTWFIHLALS